MSSLGKERPASVASRRRKRHVPESRPGAQRLDGHGQGRLERYLIVVASDVVATEPAPEKLAETGWADGVSISDSRMLVHYYRTTSDGRVVFGKGEAAWHGAAAPTPCSSRRPTARGWSSESSARPTRRWPAFPSRRRGAARSTGRRPGSLPFFWRLPGNPDVLAGFGFSGNGVGPSFVGGRILASLALGLDDEWSRAGLVRELTEPFPPEPLRYLGGRVVRAAVARKEAAEDEGRRPDRLTSSLAGLTPVSSSRGDSLARTTRRGRRPKARRPRVERLRRNYDGLMTTFAFWEGALPGTFGPLCWRTLKTNWWSPFP